jgi:hypothetical protein
MDNGSMNVSSNNQGGLFSNKNFIIIVLVILLVLSFLGINSVIVGGNLLQDIVQFLSPLVNQILSIFGHTAGTVINKSTDVIADTAKTTIDIAGGTLHSVGDILKNSSDPVEIASLKLDNSINKASVKHNEPAPDKSSNPIQKPISAAKTNWCLVGEYQGRRGCIEISEHDKCLSGQVFPDQKTCLNPTLTDNMKPKPIQKQ